MPRTWKSTLAPYFAGIPERTGFVGEARFILLNDLRYGERKLPRMVDRCAALALPAGAKLPPNGRCRNSGFPRPRSPPGGNKRGLERGQPAGRCARPRRRRTIETLAGRRLCRLRPPPAGRRPRRLGARRPRRKSPGAGNRRRYRRPATSPATICAMPSSRSASAAVAVSNDSGLLHVAAALGTPSIGIFGPTSPWHWAPLNPLAATMETTSDLPCRPCHKPVCRLGHHRCMREIAPDEVIAATHARSLRRLPRP